ncbi:separase isoform X3 [Cucumis sativus]|uniref:separase isoform X3 n=1 Tax=Cucumis sativus TaxID=3659 RepID=UPI0005EC3856|nr:separase isoform X3 [Cucumis sativus]
MASPSESALISLLETADSKGIFSLVSDFLYPFSDIKKPKKCKKSVKPTDDSSTIRSLAKEFLSFLNRALSILPKRLTDPSKLGNHLDFALELFEIYKLCLGCLECLTSQLSCKPYTVDVQRIRMVHCMEDWGLFKDAEAEGFRILDRLRDIDRRSKAGKLDFRVIHDGDKGGGDEGFCLLFVEVVATVVKCTACGRSKESGDYRRVLGLVEEVRTWFRFLDAKVSEKTQRALVTYLGKCTIFLAEELVCFGESLVSLFCLTTFAEYAKSSLRDQIYKLARRICSILFSLQQEHHTSMLVTNILACVLKSLTLEIEWKDETECTVVEFLQLICYCVNKCQSASSDCCCAFARHLEELTSDCRQETTPLGLNLRLYAVGLKIFSKLPRGGTHGSAFSILLDDKDTMQRLVSLNGFLGSYFCIGCRKGNGSCSIELKDFVGQPCSHWKSNHEHEVPSFLSWTEAYLSSYLDAIKFLCKPLAESVNSERKEILAEDKAASALYNIQNILHHFCDVFLFRQRCASDAKRDECNESVNMLLTVVVAAFTLSIRTRVDMKRSTDLIKDIISSKWIQPFALKHLFASLNNIGLILYKNKQIREASKALKLCCSASWTCVRQFCQMLDDKSRPTDSEFSENTVLSFVNEVITRSAFLIDMLYQRDMHKVERAMSEILKSWSMGATLFNGLPVPVQLVKQWVKIQCKHHKNVDPTKSTLTLYCLLGSFRIMTKAQIGTLMEQELVEYEEMSKLNPEFCQSLQGKILSTLLRDVYVTPDHRLEKARVFMKKARVLRFSETVCLDDCIQCLSEAISTMIETAGGTCSSGVLHSHQLAVAYFLRALCTHEAVPNSKQQVLQDIASALGIWLEISNLDSLPDGQRLILSEYMLLLLHNAFDLLSMKGCMDYYHSIYSLMIRLFKWKNVQLEKLLALLWESRRMSHAMCTTPANEIVIAQLSEHLGELPKSFELWTNCLKTLPGTLVVFQQTFSFLCPNYTQSSCKHEKSVRLYVTVDEVKEAASKLISHIPACTSSIFLAGHLYYDLCEKLISEGCLIEALSCAKEAHRLRSKLFKEKFIYTVEQHLEKDCEMAYISQKPAYGIKNLQKNRSAARDVWSFDKISWDVEGCYLSPFNVLQCYLESTLQVGLVHEIIGNGSEAETLLMWGKSISCLQSLPLFEVAFSSALGKLYRKKELWSLAQKELERAKQILKDSITSCLKCRLVLEVKVHQQLGDLSRDMYVNAKGIISEERLINAEGFYNLALEKLNLSTWKNSISGLDEETFLSSLTIQVERPKDKRDGKKAKKITNAPKSFQMDQCVNPQSNMRLTRSRYRTIQGQSASNSNDEKVDLPVHPKNNIPDISSALGQKQSHLQVSCCTQGSEASCKNGKVGCWQCLPMELIEAGQMNNFIYLKWEFVRRRLVLKQLSGLGKISEIRGQIHQTHETILKSMSFVVSRNLFFQAHYVIEPTVLLELIGKEVHGDVFAVERASVLYEICWFSLKRYKYATTKIICCPLSQVDSETLVSWLRVALVLCCEVPVLFQKVSRLLAVMHVISSTSELFSLASSNTILADSHWVSYFHQASVGTQFNNQFFPNTTGRSCVQDLNFAQDFDTGEERLKLKLFRRGLLSSQDLEEYVRKFFDDLPCVTMVCISLIEGDLACLLQQILHFSSSVHAWILMSHLNSKREPLVLLLPVETILKDSEDYSNPYSSDICERNDLTKHWQCPWGSSVIDEIVPAFRIILEGNYLSSSEFPSEDTKTNRKLWWKRRTKLDECLGKLLGTIEDSWLGPWKFMLLGDWSNRKHVEFEFNSLVLNLKSKCKLDVNESLLKVILEGPEEVLEAFDSKLYSRKGCIIGRERFYNKEGSNPFQNTSKGLDQVSGLALKLIQDAKKKLEVEDNTSREPIILVLDYDVQMLPWENLPVLRNQEVYRMPSVGSICATLDRRYRQQEQDGGIMAAFPSIDPLDAFYLLNPSGDLNNTQIEFENWFKDLNLEGKAGYAPTSSELIEELKSRDLFIYFGHGSGAQYIPKQEIQKLDACAASLLMGCSSGSLTLNGHYVPQGTPLSYLKAGSPVIVANLWEVTDKDIDRFGKAVLEAWLRERSCALSSSAQHDIVTKELEAMKISSKCANKKVTSLPATCESGSSSKGHSVHKRMIGSFLCEARDACTLRYLIGASPVCYGVPTSIKKKKDPS